MDIVDLRGEVRAMSRLIDADALYEQVAESEEKARDRFLDTSSSLPCPSYINPAYTRYNEQLNERTRLKHMVADAPTVDAVEVVRCKDCKHRYIENMTWHCPFGLMGGEDFFCGYGSLGRAERRSDE